MFDTVVLMLSAGACGGGAISVRYNPVVACPFNEMGVAMPRQLARVEQ
jgi:hypothetical protein